MTTPEVGDKIRYTYKGKPHTGTVKSLHYDGENTVRWVKVGAGLVNVQFILEVIKPVKAVPVSEIPTVGWNEWWA